MVYIPDDQGVALWDADGVLVNQVIELGGDSPEVKVLQASAHAVLPDLLQGWGYGRHICPWCQKALYSTHVQHC